MNNADVNIYIHVFVQMHFTSLSIYLGLEFLGHNALCLTFEILPDCFPKPLYHLYLSQQCMRVLIPPQLANSW